MRALKSSLGAAGFGALMAFASTAFAQERAGSVATGHDLAKALCRECHQVDGADPLLPTGAPSFADVAALPSTTALSLRVFFKSNHETMPNYQLTPDQIDNLVDYILSLKP
jgi:mono/diheme cytochrome c family protein